MNSYKDLIVWQKSIQLVKEVYKTTGSFPANEVYGLTSQIRRSAVSIPSNIAEGFARKNVGEYRQFLCVAFGSGAELETQLLISMELGYLKQEDYSQIQSLLTEVMKMLNTMLKNLRKG
jgi:four helix bundle protein